MKIDLVGSNGMQIELFSFPNPPRRASRPEVCGLRHLAFRVSDLDQALKHLAALSVQFEPVRVDEFTGKRVTFFSDPDGLPTYKDTEVHRGGSTG